MTQPITFVDRFELGKIKVSGSDRVEFLNNILTNDIKGLGSGGACSAALLDRTAKVLMLMTVWAFDDFVILTVEPEYGEKTIALLHKYLITEDVSLESASAQFAVITVLGRQATRDKSPHGVVAAYPYHTDILIPSGQKAQCIQMLESGGIRPGKIADLDTYFLERGILRYGKEIDETVTLPETGLEKFAASETKGCYPGQEVVAKIATYGRLQRRITGLVVNVGAGFPRLEPKGAVTAPLHPNRGDKICAGDQEIGWIANAGFSETLRKFIAIGYVRKGYFEAGKSVEIRSSSGNLKCETTALPFVQS